MEGCHFIILVHCLCFLGEDNIKKSHLTWKILYTVTSDELFIYIVIWLSSYSYMPSSTSHFPPRWVISILEVLLNGVSFLILPKAITFFMEHNTRCYSVTSWFLYIDLGTNCCKFRDAQFETYEKFLKVNGGVVGYNRGRE